MRLKEIKPEMAVHCKSDDEKKALLEEAERLGYVWYSTKNKPTERSVSGIGNTIHFYDAGTSSFSADYKHITHSCQTGDSVIEFSDLILPELTAEEAIEWISEHYRDGEWIECFERNYCMDEVVQRFGTDNVISKIAQWKSDHDKKEPEIETVDVCRIIKIQPDGRKRCVHEEDMNSQTIAEREDILKRYCMEHDGEFIAVRESVSRAKE